MNHDKQLECESLTETLNAYLDNEAAPSEKARVETHLRSCDICAKKLQDLKATKDIVKNLQIMEAPVNLWKQIETEIDKREKVISLSYYRRLPKFAALAAAIMIFLFAFTTLVGYFAPEPPSQMENLYMASHAYHVMRFPLTDRASWTYLSSEANSAVLNEE